MANGDLASSAGIFSPVLSSADIKQGYDDINRLADSMAKGDGYDTWSLSALVLNTSSSTGFGSLTDPNGNTSAPLAGGIRKAGNLLVGSFNVSYTGSTTVTANSTGNIGDATVGTLASAYRPAAPRRFNWSQGGTAQGAGRIDPSGAIVLETLDAGNNLGGGAAGIHVDFVVPLS